jgi:hypothetical protein
MRSDVGWVEGPGDGSTGSWGEGEVDARADGAIAIADGAMGQGPMRACGGAPPHAAMIIVVVEATAIAHPALRALLMAAAPRDPG